MGNIRIRAVSSSQDPDRCRFIVNRSVHGGAPLIFESVTEANGSALARRLFSLGPVTEVKVAGRIVTVGKKASASWDGLKERVGEELQNELMRNFSSVARPSKVSQGGTRGWAGALNTAL